MTDRRLFTAAALLALFAASAAAAERESAEREDLAHWQWFLELAVPPGASGRLDFVLNPAVFDKAREDLGDFRLIDGKGLADIHFHLLDKYPASKRVWTTPPGGNP